MGQYWRPCIITTRKGIANVTAWLECYKYGRLAKMSEHAYLDDPFVAAFEWLISPKGPHHKAQVVWAGDYGRTEKGQQENLFYLCNENNHASPKGCGSEYPYIVNHSQRCYVDKDAVIGIIHPLPLLTSETAGAGNGDYRGVNDHFLGRWARDVISVEETVPEGFEELECEFKRAKTNFLF